MLWHRTHMLHVACMVTLVTSAACSAPFDGLNRVLPDGPSPTTQTVDGGGDVLPATVSPRRVQLSSSLINGTFIFTTDVGEELRGTYAGDLMVSTPGQSTVVAQLIATGGTGFFDGASGELEGNGQGQFDTQQGHVVLSSLRGMLYTIAAPQGVAVHVTINGTVSHSCSSASRILMTVRGEGSVPTVGRVQVVLASEIADTECQS